MNVEIRAHGKPLSPALRLHADQRLRLALTRFSSRIRDVRLDVKLEPGPHSRCEVSVNLDSGEELRVEDESDDLRLMLDHATQRLGRLVGRRLAAPLAH
ncbi:MAG: HPF/RaiA family ribosome-associated protein [Myxococcaceae bacterium]|nr:HPF/RaiA family ribosome-associated protein [Myxococcaceae bacterium]